MSERPNILLIQVDQWRGDCLSVAGHPVVHTPYLDKLAMEGCRFTRAYSATPVCIPARAALMTGLTQRSHRRVGYRDGVEWDYPVTMAGEFSKHGYQTQCIGKLHTYPEDNLLGFEDVELHDGYLHFPRQQSPNLARHDAYVRWLREQTGRADADYFEHGLNCNSVVARPWPMEERLHPTNWCVTRALNFLETRDAARPFFLYVSLHRPHPPYDPPEWAFNHYLHTPMPNPPVGDWVDRFEVLDETPLPDAYRARYRPDIQQRARAGYYGHMSHIDHQVNRLLESLADYRLPSWVCFTSDHGEMMGDHHFYRKGMPYEGSSHVPFLLRGPEGGGVTPGATCDHVVEQRDIMPTLLECAGLPIPESVEGHNVLPQARGGGRPVREYLHGELALFGQSMQWVTDGKEKYVWLSKDGGEQFFDLQVDPRELHDLALEPSPATVRRLDSWRERLTRELAGRPEGYVENGRLVPGRPSLCLLPEEGASR